MKPKKGTIISLVLVLLIVLVVWAGYPYLQFGLRLLIGYRLPDAPAPTTIPLPATAAPIQATVVSPTVTQSPGQATAIPLTATETPAPAADTSVPATATPVATPTRSPVIVPPEGTLSLPPGFAVTVYASGLNNPRMMAVGPDGQLYVAERGANRVVRLPDRDGDGLTDGVEVVASQVNAPSSIAFYQDGSLYVAETTRVLRFYDPDAQGVFQQSEVVIDNLPAGGNHTTRTLLFSPDWSTLYVSVGSSCNVCNEADERRATIMRFNPDGTGAEIFARGLRNAVGLAIRPGTGEVWATNNGRDLLGDDLPPETVYLVQAGQDFGWPRCHSGRIVDPDFGSPGACDGVISPIVEMQAHSAPLGLTFYSGTQFPEEYRGDLFVAFHGSWNRSVPTGYKVVRIPMGASVPGTREGVAQDFAVGWLRPDNSRWGRPVGVVTGADGSLFVSDDGGGFIYRIFYLP